MWKIGHQDSSTNNGYQGDIPMTEPELKVQPLPATWVGFGYDLGTHFYTPVFRRDVLWYGAVRPSIRPSVRPSVRLLAQKNIDANGGFFSNFVHWCA